MKREIKFRAWNIGTKTMIDLKKITPLALNMDTDGLFLPFSDGLPLMQYTGLKDKTGKEVYEGDIIKTPGGNIIEVFFGQKEYRFGRDIIECNGWLARKLNGKTEMVETLDISMTAGEVIGNIYQNPELLK